MEKFFFIDYDNTIFSHQTSRIPKGAVEALVSIQQAGHKAVLASGRGLTTDSLPALPEGFTPDGVIGANGAIVQMEGETLWEHPMDQDLKSRLIDFVQEKGYLLFTSSEGQFYVSSLERYRKSHIQEVEIHLAKGDAAFKELCSKPVYSFFLNEPLDIIQETQRHFPELKLFYMGEMIGGADVIPAQNGKIRGIERVLAHYHADWSQAVAIGDSINDLEMIQAAGLGIAMGNAMPEVQKAADYVAKDIDNGGLADAVSYGLAHEWKGKQ